MIDNDKSSYTTAEAKVIFVKALEEVSTLLNKHLGEDSFSCYINLVWDKPITENQNSYHSIHALTHPEDEDKTKEMIENLSLSLYEDPFVTGSDSHRTVASFLENNYNTNMEETEQRFKVTGEDPKGVN